MKELLKKLAALEPKRFVYEEQAHDVWSFFVRGSFSEVDYLYPCNDEYAWLLTGLLLEEMPGYDLTDWGVSNPERFQILATGRISKSSESAHAAVLAAYLAYRESAATSGGGE